MGERKDQQRQCWDFLNCVIKGFLIIYDDNGDSTLLTWPQDPIEVHSIIQRCKSIRHKKVNEKFDLNLFQIRKRMVDTEIFKVQKEILKIKYST